MFFLTTWSKSEIKGEIKINHIFDVRLGLFTDVDNNKWHVYGYTSDGKGGFIIWATPLREVHDYYTDTSGMDFGFVSQSWPPYRAKIVGEKKGKQVQ